MAVSSKTFAIEESPSLPVLEIPGLLRALEVPRAYHHAFVWFQLSTAYVLLECALWSSRLSVRNRWALVAMAVVALFAATDRPSLRRLGLGLPSSFGAALVLAVSFAAAMILIFAVSWAGGPIPANATWPSLRSSWQYVIWALMQEFILQSFFFTRCEELFGSSKAVWVAATLFAAAHLPSPLLTTFTLVGGLFFCEMFRRYRSIYPIGIVHAALGLTIAMTMPDSLLHHMRVGIGYLRY
jgi:membrane protease YdiL (CAAX protease family)